jgi:hypothetical protein
MNKLTILGLALAGSILLCAYWLAGPDTPLPPKQPVAAAPSAQAGSTHSSAPPQAGKASLPPVASPVMAPAPLPPATDRQVILQAIHEASISYDPVDLPRIQPYLSHPDPEIRVAALNGIVVLGQASGAPLLRDAANRAVSSQEAALLREKADYLELPSAYDLLKAKKLSLPKTKRPERKGKSATNLPQP